MMALGRNGRGVILLQLVELRRRLKPSSDNPGQRRQVLQRAQPHGAVPLPREPERQQDAHDDQDHAADPGPDADPDLGPRGERLRRRGAAAAGAGDDHDLIDRASIAPCFVVPVPGRSRRKKTFESERSKSKICGTQSYWVKLIAARLSGKRGVRGATCAVDCFSATYGRLWDLAMQSRSHRYSAARG
ncbi:hypothetical protein PG997_005733 [Apiospora hydei]|uniref:Uncharacterized protein n=1 Tax=Apiospora hydei TaxID=1337664 RepID=A0ABR1WLV2_9PEZI